MIPGFKPGLIPGFKVLPKQRCSGTVRSGSNRLFGLRPLHQRPGRVAGYVRSWSGPGGPESAVRQPGGPAAVRSGLHWRGRSLPLRRSRLQQLRGRLPCYICKTSDLQHRLSGRLLAEHTHLHTGASLTLTLTRPGSPRQLATARTASSGFRRLPSQ